MGNDVPQDAKVQLMEAVKAEVETRQLLPSMPRLCLMVRNI